MANYRQIHTQIWTDNWFLELAPDEKLLFIYLFSNDKSSLSGIYEIHDKLISFETGMKISRINAILNKFAEAGKVYAQDGLIWIVNMTKYHAYKNESVKTRIEADIKALPDCDLKNKFLIHSGYRLGTDCEHPVLKEKEKEKEKEEEEKEEAEEKEETPAGGIVTSAQSQKILSITEHVQKTGAQLKPDDEQAIKQLVAVFKLPDIHDAIDHMAAHTSRPNVGYLRKVLDGWFTERKIQKVYS